MPDKEPQTERAQRKTQEISWDEIRKKWPEKFKEEERFIFQEIHPGDRIFIGTGCGEPQHLVQSLLAYVQRNPKAFIDAELINIVTLGVAPYTDEKFRYNFRLNSFFVGDNARNAVNRAAADYTPIFLSAVPELIRSERIPLDVALIQTTLPDEEGIMNLGVSVDAVKAAAEKASLVIAQPNSFMPRIQGDGNINIEDVDFLVPQDEPLLQYIEAIFGGVSRKIGGYVSRIVEDGSTIQVGYGSMPNAIISSLNEKKHLGVHTELLSDGIAELMMKGVVDNTQKSIHPGRTIATFCMGSRKTYDYLNDNEMVEFKTIDYTNNPLVIAQNKRMIAINSALEVDLTGQATAESLGHTFYSGIGGQADFMRGAVLAKGGKTILALPSTSRDGTESRIVPFLKEGAGVTLTRGDIHYVVTEYGIAYLHGKNIRERAMELITIAHPKFRPWLVSEAKKAGLIYQDQAFIPGERGIYPEELETWRTTKTGLNLFLRPIKISDEPLLKDFLYSLSDKSIYRRFMSQRFHMPHEFIQELVVIDYTREMAILALVGETPNEKVVGVGRYFIDPQTHTAEVAFAVRDDFHNQGIGSELLSYLTYLAKRQGLLGFTAEVFADNTPMLHVFEKGGFDIQKRTIAGLCELKLTFLRD